MGFHIYLKEKKIDIDIKVTLNKYFINFLEFQILLLTQAVDVFWLEYIKDQSAIFSSSLQ